MNILFDLIATQPEKNLKYHGGSEYAKAVFRAILPLTSGNLFCIYDSLRNLDIEIRSCCEERKVSLIDINNYESLEPVIKKYGIGKFYSALPFEIAIQKRIPFPKSVESVITIHGLRSIELPYDTLEMKYGKGLKRRLKYLYKRFLTSKYESVLFDAIRGYLTNYSNPILITVSEYSKWSLKSFFPEIPESKIHVLYSPITDYFTKENGNSFLLTNNLKTKKYFLMLSAGIWQKNSYRMLSAFKSLIEKDLMEDYVFVVVGATSRIKSQFNNSKFIYMDYLERDELESLFKDAHALVYPSLNEGFGYPPLEAFKYGTGVIASAIGPVIEVCGNAALYFNPYSLTEMKMRLIQSINDPSFINGIQPRIDQYEKIRKKQMNDLDQLVKLISS